MTVSRTFEAWRRAGLAAAVTGQPAAGSGRAALPVDVGLVGGTQTAHVPVELMGPGDVAGLDPAEILRTEPADGCPDFEPSAFAYVELASPDLPWRFTPVGEVARDLADPEPGHTGVTHRHRHVSPWLALVVVPEDLAVLDPGTSRGVPRLRCDARQLPPAPESWAWAHVQVSRAGTATDELARVLCPRRLEPDTRYLACLVPTYAAGVDGGTSLAPAWPASGETSLPAYASFRFGTAAAGSFETLARRLRPRPAPSRASGRPLGCDAPGWGVEGTTAATIMQGALRPLSGAPEPAPERGLAGRLAAAVSGGGTVGVELRPPLYGQDHAGGATAVSASTPGWFPELNTDPRRRLAAGLGAWVVAVEQDDLADRAWQQLAQPLPEKQAALGAHVAMCLAGKHAAALQSRGADAVTATMARLVRAGGPASAPGRAAARLRTRTPLTATADTTADTKTSTQRFAPTFTEPALGHLRAIDPDWLVPGSGDLADDSVAALATNPAFVEAFMVGLNHALARELVWRGYPLDPTHTMLTRFWGTSTTEPDVHPADQWDAASPLGSHSTSGRVVLLLKGALLSHFPTASVRLVGTRPDGTERSVPPDLAATLTPGTTVVGFPLTPDQALHPDPKGPDGVSAWSVAIEESVRHTRFGVDDAVQHHDSTPPPGWQDLDWGHPHLRADDGPLVHVPVAGPLDGVTRPLTASPQPVAVPQATWGADAGQLAAALQRPAFCVRIPLRLWLDDPGQPAA